MKKLIQKIKNFFYSLRHPAKQTEIQSVPENKPERDTGTIPNGETTI